MNKNYYAPTYCRGKACLVTIQCQYPMPISIKIKNNER